jgi:hypothetical protein
LFKEVFINKEKKRKEKKRHEKEIEEQGFLMFGKYFCSVARILHKL